MVQTQIYSLISNLEITCSGDTSIQTALLIERYQGRGKFLVNL